MSYEELRRLRCLAWSFFCLDIVTVGNCEKTDVAAASVGTPFPAVVEALGMGVIFEILREGGIRLPAPVGSALSIVGALIIGKAAVKDGLIGAPMIMNF